MTLPVNIRPFEKRDVPALYEMMKALARFEGYIDDFKVTTESLMEFGLGPNPTFHALVADTGEALIGYAVFYTIPFTYDLQPTAIMKELYVTEGARGTGAGKALFQAVTVSSKKRGAPRLQWLVLPSNQPAKKFYSRQGGRRDLNWENWDLSL